MAKRVNLTNPLVDPYMVLSKVYFDGKYLKNALSETSTDEKNMGRTTKICYGTLEKNIFLDRVIDENTARPPKKPVRLVLKIALYMLEFMRRHDYMVVDRAVELTKKLGKGGAAGFVNAFLRSYRVPPLPEGEDERLSVETGAPLWLVRKARAAYGDRAASILGAVSFGQCVRFEGEADGYLSGEHVDTPFEGVHIFRNFVRDEGFSEGLYTFQSVGSIAVCDVIGPCEKLLDACAGPGGKSVLLSKKCGRVTAEEIHPHRAELIRSYAERMKRDNIDIVTGDAAAFRGEWEEAFDGVLCDVPCSGSGVMPENPDIKLFRKEEDVEALTRVQKNIISNSSRYVKAGGALYYSTCSILPEENEDVAKWFLENSPEFEAEKISSPLCNAAAGPGLQFLPDEAYGAGFFVAKFIRKS
ncbi:MAG: hypothetical protein LUD29_02750 [Clostridia bacterium]|nr:hypothetical protein [Clostridia bacterium]